MKILNRRKQAESEIQHPTRYEHIISEVDEISPDEYKQIVQKTIGYHHHHSHHHHGSGTDKKSSVSSRKKVSALDNTNVVKRDSKLSHNHKHISKTESSEKVTCEIPENFDVDKFLADISVSHNNNT